MMTDDRASVEGEREDELRDAVRAAYIQGAHDVHNNWQEDRDPDFSEAASDYLASLPALARTPEPSAREKPGHTLPRIRRGEKMQLASSGYMHAALLGGGVQYHHWSENRNRVEGFVDGYNLALKHAFAALATLPPPPAAVLAERAACAAIADFEVGQWADTMPYATVANIIGRKIRARTISESDER